MKKLCCKQTSGGNSGKNVNMYSQPKSAHWKPLHVIPCQEPQVYVKINNLAVMRYFSLSTFSFQNAKLKFLQSFLSHDTRNCK